MLRHHIDGVDSIESELLDRRRRYLLDARSWCQVLVFSDGQHGGVIVKKGALPKERVISLSLLLGAFLVAGGGRLAM